MRSQAYLPIIQEDRQNPIIRMLDASENTIYWAGCHLIPLYLMVFSTQIEKTAKSLAGSSRFMDDLLTRLS